MHVKETVKEFVHDVKRKFSQKRKRDSCSTCTFDSFDEDSSDSSTDTLPRRDARDSTSSSSIASLPLPPDRGRFVTFVRPRTASASSAKRFPRVLHKARSLEGKRYRFFSSERASDASQSNSTQARGRGIQWSPLSIQDAGEECETIGSSQGEYMDVLDIRAWPVRTDSLQESTRSESRDSSQTQLFDTESHSDTSGTLVTIASTPTHPKSVSESDSRFDVVILDSDDIAPLVATIHPMAQPPQVPLDSPPDPREEEITLAATLDKPTTAPSLSPPVVPRVPRTITSAQPIRSTPASPAPVYIPRLTAPSMFLPVPNVRLIFPLSHSLVWWLAPKWSSGFRLPPSVSMFLPHSGNKSTFMSPQPTRSRPHLDFFPRPFPNSRQ